MSADKFFPPRSDFKPTIYAYEGANPQYRGLLKIGYTTVDARSRVAQQYPTLRPGKPLYRLALSGRKICGLMRVLRKYLPRQKNFLFALMLCSGCASMAGGDRIVGRWIIPKK